MGGLALFLGGRLLPDQYSLPAIAASLLGMVLWLTGVVLQFSLVITHPYWKRKRGP